MAGSKSPGRIVIERGITMKRYLIIPLLLLLYCFPAHADSIKAPRGFAGKLWSGVMVLYATNANHQTAIRTTEPYEKIKGGYRLISAGHCVVDDPANLVFSVAEEIGSPATVVTLVKSRHDREMD